MPAGSDEHRCFGPTRMARWTPTTKCQHTFEFVIPLPDAARRGRHPVQVGAAELESRGAHPARRSTTSRTSTSTSRWAPIAEVFAIEPGPCGPEFVRCDQFQTGEKAAAAQLHCRRLRRRRGGRPGDGQSPDRHHRARVPAKEPFTRSWIYGVYDGKVIFYEAMVTRALPAEQAERLPADQGAEGRRGGGVLSDRILRASQRGDGGIFGVDGEIHPSRGKRAGTHATRG